MVPVGLMIISVILFVVGRPYYKIRKPEGNVFAEASSITWTALRTKCKSKGSKEGFSFE